MHRMNEKEGKRMEGTKLKYQCQGVTLEHRLQANRVALGLSLTVTPFIYLHTNRKSEFS